VRAIRRCRVGFAALILANVVVPAEVAAAATSVRSGWWTTAATPASPDVPPDGLLVESTLTPTAYAAVSFDLGQGELAKTLTLSVTEGSASNPATTLRVCPLVEPIVPAQGGSSDAAPAYDCTTAVDAKADAGTYAFDVSQLAATGSFAVAVLPTGPLDRTVLNAPEVDSLTSSLRPAPTPSTGGPSTEPAPLAPPSPAPPLSSGGSVELPALESPPTTAPPPNPAQEVAQPTLPVDSPAGSSSSRVAQVGLGLAVLFALALWLVAGNLASSRARRELLSASAPA